MRNPIFGVGTSPLLLRMLVMVIRWAAAAPSMLSCKGFLQTFFPSASGCHHLLGGPWTSTIPWVIALKVICPLSC